MPFILVAEAPYHAGIKVNEYIFVHFTTSQFVMNKYRDQKIQETSFLDEAFMKTLAGAVRFGTTLLVENVEKLDPVLNPIVSRDLIAVPSSFIMMYKVLIHCTHCSSLIVEQGDPAHRWPLISEVSQSQRLSIFFLSFFSQYIRFLSFSELEQKTLITAPSSTSSSPPRTLR